MSSPMMNELPFETLQQIAGLLQDTHLPSLRALALVNERCYRATRRSVFRKVHLNVQKPDILRDNVERLLTVLSATESAQHVRHLGLAGDLLHEVGQGRRSSPADDYDMFNYFELTGFGEILGDEEPPISGYFFPDDTIRVSPEEDAAWAPVVQLFKTLPYLAKLVYDCRNQFPPSLLEALHKYQPQCKLDHLAFRLRSLRCDALDPHEMALATSPCLHSVKLKHAWRDSNGKNDYHDKAMPELVASLAPNLKEVSMLNLYPSTTEQSRRRHRIVREPWRGFSSFVPCGSSTGSLTSLTLAGDLQNISIDCLQIWKEHTNFSLLEHLALGGGHEDHMSGISSDILQWIAKICTFPRMRSLRIRLYRGVANSEDPYYASNAKFFFESLEPLQQLTIDGSLENEILDTILSRHGCNLSKLSLRPSETGEHRQGPMTFEKTDIQKIQAQCPVLQELAVTVRRTAGDSHEAEIYRSFAEMKQLKALFLTLDCSHRQGPYATIEMILKCCAVDENLARSIWKTICPETVRNRLRSLKLFPIGGEHINMLHDTSRFLANLRRYWLIEKSVRDDEEDIINVRELGKPAREARDRDLTAFYEMHYGGDMTGSTLPDNSTVYPFRRIWPRKEGSKDWREDWTSLPLHGAEPIVGVGMTQDASGDNSV